MGINDFEEILSRYYKETVRLEGRNDKIIGKASINSASL